MHLKINKKYKSDWIHFCGFASWKKNVQFLYLFRSWLKKRFCWFWATKTGFLSLSLKILCLVKFNKLTNSSKVTSPACCSDFLYLHFTKQTKLQVSLLLLKSGGNCCKAALEKLPLSLCCRSKQFPEKNLSVYLKTRRPERTGSANKDHISPA